MNALPQLPKPPAPTQVKSLSPNKTQGQIVSPLTPVSGQEDPAAQEKETELLQMRDELEKLRQARQADQTQLQQAKLREQQLKLQQQAQQQTSQLEAQRRELELGQQSTVEAPEPQPTPVQKVMEPRISKLTQRLDRLRKSATVSGWVWWKQATTAQSDTHDYNNPSLSPQESQKRYLQSTMQAERDFQQGVDEEKGPARFGRYLMDAVTGGSWTENQRNLAMPMAPTGVRSTMSPAQKQQTRAQSSTQAYAADHPTLQSVYETNQRYDPHRGGNMARTAVTDWFDQTKSQNAQERLENWSTDSTQLAPGSTLRGMRQRLGRLAAHGVNFAGSLAAMPARAVLSHTASMSGSMGHVAEQLRQGTQLKDLDMREVGNIPLALAQAGASVVAPFKRLGAPLWAADAVNWLDKGRVLGSEAQKVAPTWLEQAPAAEAPQQTPPATTSPSLDMTGLLDILPLVFGGGGQAATATPAAASGAQQFLERLNQIDANNQLVR